MVEDKIRNPYLNGKSVHPLDVLDRKAKEAKNKPKFKCGSLDPSVCANHLSRLAAADSSS